MLSTKSLLEIAAFIQHVQAGTLGKVTLEEKQTGQQK